MTKITIDRALVEQALKALEMSRRFVYADNRPQCDEAIDALRAALAQEQDEPAQQTRKDGHYSVAYRCECGHKQNVTEIVRGGRTYAGSGANWCDGCGDGPPVRVDAIQQQAEPHPDYPCRSDGRCQYAIDHGAEGLGSCPKGKCAIAQPQPAEDRAVAQDNLRVMREMFGEQAEPVQEPVPAAVVATQSDVWRGYNGQWQAPGGGPSRWCSYCCATCRRGRPSTPPHPSPSASHLPSGRSLT